MQDCVNFVNPECDILILWRAVGRLKELDSLSPAREAEEESYAQWLVWPTIVTWLLSGRNMTWSSFFSNRGEGLQKRSQSLF